jgi:hypothetical protein
MAILLVLAFVVRPRIDAPAEATLRALATDEVNGSRIENVRRLLGAPTAGTYYRGQHCFRVGTDADLVACAWRKDNTGDLLVLEQGWIHKEPASGLFKSHLALRLVPHDVRAHLIWNATFVSAQARALGTSIVALSTAVLSIVALFFDAIYRFVTAQPSHSNRSSKPQFRLPLAVRLLLALCVLATGVWVIT